jgi:hypothetical protein
MRSNQQPTYLLDKNVIRRAITGIARAEFGRPLTREEDDCLSLLHEARKSNLRLFISIEAFNILQRLSKQLEVQVFLASTEILQAGRYFKRWARRLREYSFTSEDAKILSLGSFGTDEVGELLGVHAVITLDQHFINNYHTNLASLQRRLKAMAAQLSSPFCQATLPDVKRPSEVLAAMPERRTG